MDKKQQDFESSVSRLEEILEIMENDTPSLKEMLELYREGVELSVFCMGTLNKAQEEVSILRQTAGGLDGAESRDDPFELVAFDEDADDE
ncbi:MAG: exodeoxyribonuclease VII small subunit [Clostridiales bacterium]|jgi:exodeoxyribonuclease VII small subunit|nr:exodeoxyribonuclease VII small subunit [Clostridiales bacterium]